MKCCFLLSIYLFFCFSLTETGARTLQQPKADSIPPASVKPSDWDVAVECVQLSGEARWLRDSFAEISERSIERRSALDGTIEKMLLDTTTGAEQLKSIKNDLKEAQKEEKETEKNLKKAKTTAEFAELVANMDARQQRAQLPKSRKQVQQLKNILYPSAPSLATETAPKKEKTKKEKPDEEPAVTVSVAPVQVDSSTVEPPRKPETITEKPRNKPKSGPQPPKVVFKTYSSAEDVMIHPPVPPCALASNVRDEFSGEVRREMPRSEIFRYTNQALRKTYTDKAHTIGEVSLLSIGINAAIHLSLHINDPYVRRTQGSLQKSSVAILKFMDGYSITLYNARADEGATDPEGKFVLFQAEFPIDRTTIKKLRNTELDRIRVAWSNGYEDYDVQQVDLLMWQAKCLFD